MPTGAKLPADQTTDRAVVRRGLPSCQWLDLRGSSAVSDCSDNAESRRQKRGESFRFRRIASSYSALSGATENSLTLSKNYDANFP